MSYNPYPTPSQNYSPYYQQPVSQDGRSQYTEPSRGNNAYQHNTYQPLSAYQTSQPASSAPESNSSGSAYNDSVYGSGAGGRQDSRAAYNDGRSSVDTTALGNLAYASSLGRDTSNLQQTMGYNRGQNTAGYSASASYGTSTASPIPYGSTNQRTESNNAATASRDNHSRAHSAISSPSFGYSSNNGNTGYQSQSQHKAGVGQGQSQYASTQYPQSSEPYRVSQYSEPARPSSGQALRRPPSTTGSQGASPVVGPSSSARLQSDGNYRKVSTSSRLEQPRVPTPQQQQTQTRVPPPSGSQGQYSRNVPSKQAASTATLTNAVQISNPSAQAAKATPANNSQRSNHTRTSSDNQTNGQKSQESTPKVSQFPTTVNPSQVFNDAEYQRRQATAAAEAEATRKKVEEERVAALPQERPSSTSASSAAEAAKKEQMELEMKQMIEKMRDYRSKDPSLFSQIWEQVKKGQPAPRASPQVAAQGSSASPVVINDQLPSPVVNLPPESELSAVDGSFPPNFNRGRFPAQRRRRGGANFTPDKKQRTPKGSAKSTPTGSTLDPSNETMQKAMADFHTNSASPMPAAQASQASQSHYVFPPPQEKQTQPTSAQDTVPGSSAPTYSENIQAPSRPPPTSNQASAAPTPGPVPGSLDTPTPTNPQVSQVHNKPSPPKSGGTYWPENKKRQLAEAARYALISSPKNYGKQISSIEIHQLLDQNPSYTQMCEILEYRGFVIDRGQFARLLLSAVPDLGASSKPSTNPLPQHMTPTAPTAQMTGGPGGPSSAQAGIPRPMPYSAPQSVNGYVTPYPNQSGQYTTPQAQMSQYQPNPAYRGHGILYPHAPYPQPSQPPKPHVRWSDNQQPAAANTKPAPTTKQNMARKRSFGDIVDLTQAMSDDEDEPPSQRPRTDDGSALRVYAAGRSVNSGTATPTSVKDTANLEEYRYKPTGQDEYLRVPDIVRPMNKRQDALRRSSYNPKTIARDILLAIGKHPTMAPLNAHLDDLRERFTAVNYESDLATFRWDLVDPGGPALVQEATVDEDSHQSRRSSRMAVVVGGNKSSNVESGLRYTKAFKPTRGGHIASSSRQPVPDKIFTHPQTPQNPTLSSRGGITRTSLSDSGFSRFVHNDLPVMLNGITGTTTKTTRDQSSAATTPASSTAKVRVHGRVGRPPGARNKNPRPDRGTPRKPRISLTQQQHAPKKDETPPISNGDQENDNQDSGDQDAPREASPSQSHATPTSPLKFRPRISTTPARPSNLRNAITPIDGIAVVIPSRSPSVMDTNSPAASVRSFAKNTASFPVSKPKIQQSPAPSSSYKVYKCQWDKCPAELHNLSILKKHVRKHRSEDDFKSKPRPCLWKGCLGYNSNRPTLASVEEWDSHVLSKHVEPADEEDAAREQDKEPSDDASDSSLPPAVRTNKDVQRGRIASGFSPVRPMVVLRS